MTPDALTPLLAQLGIRGAIFSRADLAAPWGVRTGGASTAIFHVVVRGAGFAQRLGDDGTLAGAPVAWRAGDLVLFPHGAPHALTDQPEGPTRPIHSLTTEPEPGQLPSIRVAGGGACTDLLCGTLQFEPWGAALLLPHLPPLLHVPGGEGATATWLDATLRMLGAEVAEGGPGSEAIISRLSEVLFIHAVRAWAGQQPEGAGWVGALAHPGLAAALGAAHARPAEPWSVARLARAAGMSRSAFSACFAQRVGVPPATHLMRWRMGLARRALATTDHGLAEIADGVGYASEASLIRAFLRETGETPTRWRRTHSARSRTRAVNSAKA
jgi:AraC-like DNA-binding protein